MGRDSGSDGRPGFRRRDHSVAPWIRTRLRTAPGAAVALALLVMATACLAAAFPRAVERYEDAGLRQAVVDATAPRTSLQVSAPQPGNYIPQSERETALRPESMRKSYERVLNVVERPLAVDSAQSVYGVRNINNLEAAETWLPHAERAARTDVARRAERTRRALQAERGPPSAREGAGDRRDPGGGGRGHHGDGQAPQHQGGFGDPRARGAACPARRARHRHRRPA